MHEPAYLSRRTVAAVLPTAALAAAPAASLPSLAAAIHPDADLLSLVASLQAAEARREDCDREINEAFDRLEMPKIPEALYWRKSDFPGICSEHPKGRLAHYDVGGGQLEWVYESIGDLPSRWTGPQPSPVVFGKPNEQIIAAIGAWQEANRRAEDAVGLTTASEASERAHAIADALERRLLSTRAKTTEGVMAKIQLMIEQWPPIPVWLEQQMQAELAKTEGREMAKGVRDFARPRHDRRRSWRDRGMSAVILAFPRPSPVRALVRPADGSAPFTPAWCAQHLPLIDAAMDLLEADDAEFARRCEAMRDEEGRRCSANS